MCIRQVSENDHTNQLDLCRGFRAHKDILQAMSLLGESRAVQLVGIQALHSLVMDPEGQPLVAQEQVLLISCFYVLSVLLLSSAAVYLCSCFPLLLETICCKLPVASVRLSSCTLPLLNLDFSQVVPAGISPHEYQCRATLQSSKRWAGTQEWPSCSGEGSKL